MGRRIREQFVAIQLEARVRAPTAGLTVRKRATSSTSRPPRMTGKVRGAGIGIGTRAAVGTIARSEPPAIGAGARATVPPASRISIVPPRTRVVPPAPLPLILLPRRRAAFALAPEPPAATGRSADFSACGDECECDGECRIAHDSHQTNVAPAPRKVERLGLAEVHSDSQCMNSALKMTE